MIKYTFYIIYNLLYQLGAFFFFLYSNTYLNESFVPESLMWKKNQPRTDRAGLGGVAVIKTSALLIEAAILILLIYFINKLTLRGVKGAASPNIIANRTAKINITLSLCFIAILIWGSFRGFLW
jgi:hypothetical protein